MSRTPCPLRPGGLPSPRRLLRRRRLRRSWDPAAALASLAVASVIAVAAAATFPVGPLLAQARVQARAQVQAQVQAQAQAQAPAGVRGAGQSTPAARPLPIEDYDRWRTIVSVELSPDGAWMTYAYGHRTAEDTLVVLRLDGGAQYEVPGGFDPVFSDDARWATMRIEGEAGEVRLLDLASGGSTSWNGAGRVTFAPGARYLAIRKAPDGQGASHRGTDLLIRDLGTGSDLPLGNVTEFAFDSAGGRLAYLVDADRGNGNGIYLLDLEAGTIRTLDSDALTYANLTWRDGGTALAALKGKTGEGLRRRDNTLVAFRALDRDDPERLVLDPTGASGFPAGFVISEQGRLAWRSEPSMILFGIKEQEARPPAADAEHPAPSVVVFHWKDDYLQTVQERRAAREERFTYRSGMLVPSGRYVPLADATMRSLEVPEGGAWAVGSDQRAYVSDWKEDRADYYRVDLVTGERSPMLTAQKRVFGLSPDGRTFLYWKEGHFWAHDLERGTDTNLTASAPVSFVNEQWDHPGTKPPYGLAGWTADGRGLVLNHRYDLWMQPLDGSEATNLTQGRGARDEIRLRVLPLDEERETIDLSRPLLLTAYGEWTKKEGYFELDHGRLTERIWQDRKFGDFTKAARADRVAFTSQTFADPPDYYVSDLAFQEPRRVTDVDPQQAEYRWGRTQLFDFENRDGVRLQGTLAIPDGYEPGQRLPMIVNFYEKKSQYLHRYWAPTFGGDYPSGNAGPVAEFAAWVSNGYLVMQLDVHFNTGTTHSDMLDCVEAATRRVIEMGYADPDRIALTGGSFSGGGSAFIATQSDMFAAIVSRAAPINLAGEFDILFSGSGENNHSYDIYGQGRYGTNPFDDFDLYRAQSPITHVQGMNTPLLYMHGRNDPSVEYLQGMEFYNALRFLGKPIIFLTYRDEGHNLHRYENQLDFTRRMRQFLDHYLKDAPAPEWMVKGLPFRERGR